MVPDFSRIYIGSLLLILLIISYFLNLDYLILLLITLLAFYDLHKSKLIRIFGYLNEFVAQYSLYKPYFGNSETEKKLFPGKMTEDVDLSQIKKSINKRIEYIESFNAATLGLPDTLYLFLLILYSCHQV